MLGRRYYTMPKLYTQEDFDNAIAAIKCGLSYRKAAMQFGVPKSTLTDRIAGGKHKRQEQVFAPQEEEGFVEYFHKLCSRECGLNSFEVRNIIKCWLDRDHRTVLRFKNNMPTSNWVTQFKKRHPTLNIKPLKTAKPVKVKVEHEQERHVDVVGVQKVYPDSTQESLVEHNVQSTTQRVSYIDHNVPSSMVDCSIPSSAMEESIPPSEMEDTIPTIVRPISPLVINHEIPSSVSEENVPSSTMEHIALSPVAVETIPVVTPSDAPPLVSPTTQSIRHGSINTQKIHSYTSRLNSSTGNSRLNANNSQSNGTLSEMLPTQSKNCIALKALEATLCDHDKNMFYRRFDESHSLEVDVLYLAWKVLKHRCANESPTMVNNFLRCEKRNPYSQKRSELPPNPVAEETLIQLQEIINKYQDVDMGKYSGADDDRKPSVIVENSDMDDI